MLGLGNAFANGMQDRRLPTAIGTWPALHLAGFGAGRLPGFFRFAAA